MSQPLTQYAKPLRTLLGLRFGVRTDAELLDALAHVLRCGHVPGHTVTPALDRVTPDITAPKPYVQLLYRALLALVLPDVAANAFDTRAYKERLGDAWPFVLEAQRVLYEAETQGADGVSWQGVAGLLVGVDGLDEIFRAQAPATVTGSFPGLNFSVSGVSQT